VSVEFDPVPLGRPRRRLDPIVILVVLVVAGLGLAVIKPWERRDEPSNGIAAASPSASASADADPSEPPGGPRIDIVTVDRSTPARPLDHPGFAAEYITPSADGPTVLDTGSRSIVALGVAPHADGVLSDVRISQIRADGSLDPLEAAPMGGVAAGGAVVLAPEGQTAAFPAGRYRIEAVVDGTDRRLDVVIPDAMMLAPPVTTALTWTHVARAHLPVRSFSVDVVSVDWSASTGSVGYPVYAEGRHAPSPEGPTVLDTGGRSIVALGVDPADGSVVRDVRIYRVRADGGLDWVEANPVDGGEAGGPLALAIPDAAIAFPAGRYRVDALVDGAIRRVEVAIPRLDGTVPPPFAAGPPGLTGLVPLRSTDPSEVRSGPFVTTGGRAIPLDVAPVDPLDETGAWLDALATPDSADRPTVARVYQPQATGLGVMLTSHARIVRAGIVRLAPDVPLDPIATIGGVSYNRGGTPWIGFAGPDLGAWPPGDYAINVVWSDADGRHDRTWHVELRPGPSTPSAPAPG
jgi:hypothetical protein